MKIIYLILIFIVCKANVGEVYAGAGPEAVEEKWETCNARLDNSLQSFINVFGSLEYYTVKGFSQCPTCKVWDLNTIERTGDTHFEKVPDDLYRHTEKLRFTHLRFLCQCSSNSDSGKESVDGEVELQFTEPRFTVQYLSNKERNVVTMESVKIDSDMEKTLVEECKGNPAWNEICEEMKKEKLFHPALVRLIERFYSPHVDKFQNYVFVVYCGD